MIYTYRCPKHGEFEEEHPMGEAPPTAPCPARNSASETPHGLPCTRAWTRAIHFGYGFNPYGDRIVKSKEAQERFMPGRG